MHASGVQNLAAFRVSPSIFGKNTRRACLQFNPNFRSSACKYVGVTATIRCLTPACRCSEFINDWNCLRAKPVSCDCEVAEVTNSSTTDCLLAVVARSNDRRDVMVACVFGLHPPGITRAIRCHNCRHDSVTPADENSNSH